DVRDTLLMSQLLTAGTLDRNGLAECCQRYLGRELSKEQQRSDWSGELTAEQLAYAARDVLVLHPLLKALRKEIKKAGLQEALAVETAALPAVAWMSNSGVPFDKEAWLRLGEKAAEDAERLRAELAAAAPPRPDDAKGRKQAWNFNSQKQVKE